MKRQLCMALAMLLFGTACAAPVYLQPSSPAYYFNITIELEEDAFVTDEVLENIIKTCKEYNADSSAFEWQLKHWSKNGGVRYTNDNWIYYILPTMEFFGKGGAQQFLEENRGKRLVFRYDGDSGFGYHEENYDSEELP